MPSYFFRIVREVFRLGFLGSEDFVVKRLECFMWNICKDDAVQVGGLSRRNICRCRVLGLNLYMFFWFG